MGIKPNFNSKDLRKLQDQIEQNMFQQAIKAYQYIGEKLISHAREKVGFTDQTGNLRSSIGYILFVNGQVYNSNYLGSSEGQAEGKKLASDIKAGIPKQPIVLVCTAGMNYAYQVETKGYNVLSATENYAESVVKSLLEKLLK